MIKQICMQVYEYKYANNSNKQQSAAAQDAMKDRTSFMLGPSKSGVKGVGEES